MALNDKQKQFCVDKKKLQSNHILAEFEKFIDNYKNKVLKFDEYLKVKEKFERYQIILLSKILLQLTCFNDAFKIDDSIKYQFCLHFFKPNLTINQRLATSLFLDVIFPEWRNIIGFENLGIVADRNSKEVLKWKKFVFQRDTYKCIDCGSDKGLHAHHLIHWSDSPELRTCVDNGVTLCSECHKKRHPELNFI
jgi:hypothetical protein